ncbi:Kv channel-interacting protein 1-like isoform X1 [Daktulosphaira vitifoliae]|uniref:Kv channel-interacting protein 1-like isoform X1 n=1 Tax=Daktulosphaira vitifoliae TaxID=58002 RepID=UPI0021A9E0A6|nr:Kv channel-interacting protein 1-like isoform X1 [Daktulosphaira vitifoliae]XP_050544619.1 Kv channel-interacting protein 1-like isoform X1 [Daktulosphaira vitifoliae]XP_050544621.1 Kv channel-interacting protein 1-like isoform X1 [Daktulosphaira vitifoliae]XP_050544622.1 Kv channel-interacting protein 1-like isoform X1 [Daktulosphaira vitifoliae]
MYSVVAHQNYGRERRERQQAQQHGHQSQQHHHNQQSGAPSGGSGAGPSSAKQTSSQQHPDGRRRSQRHRNLSITVRFLNYLKRRFNRTPEEDIDDFNIQVSRYRPEELSKLTKITKFNKKEIQLIYRGFKQECPTGMVDEDSFKTIFSQFFPQGDATQYAQYVFNTIKRNQSGKISFEDFLAILSKVSRGSVQEKLHWIFGLYDLNKDGVITKKEMQDVVHSIYSMLGRHTNPQTDDQTAKDHVDRIFHLMDKNNDGNVTLDEMVAWCSRDEGILQSLDTLDTVL